MSKLKRIAFQIPEYLLIASVIFYWGSAGWEINYIAISLLVILILQIIFKNRIIGIIIPSLLTLASLFLILAVISEFKEFPTVNAEAMKLLLVGLVYFTSTIIVSGMMFYKYALHDQ